MRSDFCDFCLFAVLQGIEVEEKVLSQGKQWIGVFEVQLWNKSFLPSETLRNQSTIHNSKTNL